MSRKTPIISIIYCAPCSLAICLPPTAFTHPHLQRTSFASHLFKTF